MLFMCGVISWIKCNMLFYWRRGKQKKKKDVKGNQIDRNTLSTQDERIKQTTALYQMFGGFMQNHFLCDTCQKGGNDYDAFLHLSLNIDSANTVEKCLSQHIRQQNVKGYKCPR